MSAQFHPLNPNHTCSSSSITLLQPCKFNSVSLALSSKPSRLITNYASNSDKPSSESATAGSIREGFLQFQNDPSQSQWNVEVGSLNVPGPSVVKLSLGDQAFFLMAFIACTAMSVALQVFEDGEWIGVEPISNGLEVNIGYQLRIISNRKLKCAEQRVVTNSSTVRTTIGFLITPSPDCYIEPAAALINARNPRLYTGFQYEEFRANYFRKQGKTEVVLEPFKIES